jgi:hypothetical protein
MYATMRQYAGITPADFDSLLGHEAEIKTLIRNVPGFVQYDLIRTADGVTTLTVCHDRTGAEVSNLQVAAWIEQNLPAMMTTALVTTGGEDMLRFSA